jgi:hypothetical protein
MSTGDLIVAIVAITSNAAGIFFGWQQNQIFKEQNRIFAAQAGVKMPETDRHNRVGLYWPAIAAVFLAGGVGIALTEFGTISLAFPWALVALLTFGTTFSVMRLKNSLGAQQSAIADNVSLKQQLVDLGSPTVLAQPSKLVIHSADYGAIEGGGVDYPVKDFLNQIAGPSCLAFEIRNSQFKVNGWDYVPDDPKDFKEKRLKVTYSYDGGSSHTIRRREKTWLVLPEDPYIEGFPLLRLDVIDAWCKLDTFFRDQRKRLLNEQVSDAGRAGALLYSATPDADPYLAVEYDRSLKSEMVDLYQRLKIYGIRDDQLQPLVRSLEQPVYHANCRDAIENMMEILWEIAPKITHEDDESTRVPGRLGRPKKVDNSSQG